MQNAKGRHQLFLDDGPKNNYLLRVRRYPVPVITRRLASAVRVTPAGIRIGAGSREPATRFARANQFLSITRSPANVVSSLFIARFRRVCRKEVEDQAAFCINLPCSG